MFDAQHLIDGIVGGTLVKTLDLLRDISHTRIAERLRSELLTDLEFYRKRSIDLEQARIQLGHDLQNAQMWKYNIDAVMARHGVKPGETGEISMANWFNKFELGMEIATTILEGDAQIQQTPGGGTGTVQFSSPIQVNLNGREVRFYGISYGVAPTGSAPNPEPVTSTLTKPEPAPPPAVPVEPTPPTPPTW